MLDEDIILAKIRRLEKKVNEGGNSGGGLPVVYIPTETLDISSTYYTVPGEIAAVLEDARNRSMPCIFRISQDGLNAGFIENLNITEGGNDTVVNYYLIEDIMPGVNLHFINVVGETEWKYALYDAPKR